MAVTPVQRKLAAIFAADIAGYSRLMARDEVGTLARLKASRVIVDGLIASHRGRIFNTAGDSVVVDFASAVDAVQCALAVQAALAGERAGQSADEPLVFRIGVHVGDVIVDGTNLLGDGVNIAARLEALAEPGGVCVSSAVREHVGNKLPVGFDDLGEQQVKNIPHAVRAYRVTTEFPSTVPAPVSAPPALSLPDKPSIAVLPFRNLSGDPEQEYFVDGMVEEIITALSHIRWLFVIARNSSFTYKGRAVDVKQVARELGVRYVLEGSVRKAGSRVRITGQLIDTASSAHIWAEHFDGTLDDIFALQDQVASNVAGTIEPKLRSAEIDRSSRKPAGSLDAYDLYLRAVAQFRNNYTQESLREAIALLQQALSIAPGYAPAAALIGRCRAGQRVQGWGPLSDAEIAEAVRLARQAADMGKSDPEALWLAAWTLSGFAGEHDIAASAIDRALTLNPNAAEAWTARGWIACYQNDPNRAIEAFEHATRLSPLDPSAYHNAAGRALAHMIAGQYEKASEWAERSLGDFPRYGPSIRTKLAACVQLGRIAEARDLLTRMNELQPELTVAKFTAYMAKNFPPDTLAVYAEGLRQAGLPEG